MLDIDTGAAGGKLLFVTRESGKDSQLWRFVSDGTLESKNGLVAHIDANSSDMTPAPKGDQVRQLTI